MSAIRAPDSGARALAEELEALNDHIVDTITVLTRFDQADAHPVIQVAPVRP